MIAVRLPECPKCGSVMKREGFFFICLNCGKTYDQDGLDLDEIIRLSLEKRGNRGTGKI